MDKFGSFRRRNPFHPKPFRHDAREFQKFFHKLDPFTSHVVAVHIVAIPYMATADEYTVNTPLKSPQYVVSGDGTAAHHPDNPDVGRILQSADTCQVRCGVRSPCTHHCQDSGLKRFFGHCRFLFIRLVVGQYLIDLRVQLFRRKSHELNALAGTRSGARTASFAQYGIYGTYAPFRIKRDGLKGTRLKAPQTAYAGFRIYGRRNTAGVQMFFGQQRGYS